MGRPDAYQLLSGSLMADPSALKHVDWTPVVSSRDGLVALMRSGGRDEQPRRERAVA